MEVDALFNSLIEFGTCILRLPIQLGISSNTANRLPFEPYPTSQDDLVVSMSTSDVVGHGFASRPSHTKDHYKNGTNCLLACHGVNVLYALYRSSGIWCCMAFDAKKALYSAF